MAGKSTFLRQNALIAVLAQMGSFVPADGARISASSTACSRASARPTIWRAAARPSWSRWSRPPPSSTRRPPASLVILDEIGRGTATFDGLSIAWAAIEHLHEVNRCRALFATHYHELTALADTAAAARQRHHARSREWQGDVVFLHEVVPGAADRSYGIQVAKLAGLPPAVVERARTILASSRNPTASARRAWSTTCRCSRRRWPPAGASPPDMPDALREALGAIDPDEMTPREALEALYRLKGALES